MSCWNLTVLIVQNQLQQNQVGANIFLYYRLYKILYSKNIKYVTGIQPTNLLLSILLSLMECDTFINIQYQVYQVLISQT